MASRPRSRKEGRASGRKPPAARPPEEEQAAGDGSSDERAPVGRPLWSGAVSFGLLQIPVAVYAAEERSGLSFHQYDRRDLAPIGYQRINKITGKTIESADVVKGYPVDDGQIVVLTPEDFDAAAVERTGAIDIHDFVDLADIDVTHFETPYYLAPAGKSQKAYAVLREALRRQRKAAIATFVLRSREHLCAIVPQGDALLLEVLRYGHELRAPDALPLPRDLEKLKVHPRELEMAERLIEGMSGAWEPSKYRDTYRDVMLAKIEEKAKTGRVTPAQPAPRPQVASNVVDIMAVLRESVQRAQRERVGGGGGGGAGGLKKASGRRPRGASAA